MAAGAHKAEIGIIGGSGLYAMPGLINVTEERLSTPFGEPSDAFVLGELEGRKVAFLARHGRGHRILPTELNFRANIYAMKKLGVGRIVSVSAVGSLQEEHRPGDFLVPDQFIDRTFLRTATFFGEGIVGHVSFGDPVCAVTAGVVHRAVLGCGITGRLGGTYVCMEGPQFSTRAESNLYRSWGVDVISMTAMQEARLAREAELCYATLVLVTDYDCWHESVSAVDIGEILRVMSLNVATAQKAVALLARSLGARGGGCTCATALKDAVITDRAMIPPKRRAELELLIGKYL